MKRLLVLFVGIAVLFAFTVIPVSYAEEPIKIGILGVFTGPASDIGEPMLQGAKLAIEEINAKGGVQCGAVKRKLEPVVVDDENSPSKSVSGIQRLINKDKVTVVLGPAGSGCALATRQVANTAKTVMVTPAINDAIFSNDMPFIFGSACKWSDQVQGIVDLVAGKYKKFALLHDTSGLGEGGATEFKKAFAKRGIKVVIEEKFEVNTLNLMPQITRIKNAGADFICASVVGADAITIGKLMKQINYDVPVAGNNGLGMRITLKAADKLEGWIFADTVDGNKPQFKEFIKRYRARYNVIPTYHPASQAYDAIYGLAKALEKSKGQGGQALADAMRSGITVNGATCKVGTSFAWSSTRKNAIDASQLALWKIHNNDYEMLK